ncbi:MAG TPA: FG-GAP-like repeat-containing protein, partial [Polyangia bacterium]|nr:FG-GAP-like repeat-containing protein [Polyangia bacterium]
MKRSIAPLWAVLAALLGVGGAARAGTQVDSFYGAFGTEIEIEVPKLRSLEPSVKLTYSSTGTSGFAGVGWSLSTASAIQRSAPGGGTPRYDASDTFYLDGQELVPCADLGGTHCTRVQSYQRIQWDAAASRWTVTQKSGVRAVYTPLVQTALGVFRWGLSSITDTHGNTVSFNYWCDAPSGSTDECYLDNVAYNGAVVRFYREARPDPVLYGRGTSLLGRMSYRLRSIDVTVGGGRLRAYRLGYAQGTGIGRSLLVSVQQYGRDATLDAAGNVTGGTALPASTFGYSGGGVTYQYGYEGPAYSDASGWGAQEHYSTIRFPDVNGDGKADMCARHSGGIQCYLGTGTGLAYGFEGPGWTSAGGWGADQYNSTIQYPDLNGDGKADICGRHSGGIQCWLSTGTGFTYAFDGPAYSDASGWGAWEHYSTIRFPDINGDGKADLCARHSGGIQCYYGTGTGFVYGFEGPRWTSAGGWGAAQYNSTIQYPDLNGDGKADICGRHSGGIQCWLSTGTGFTYAFDGPAYSDASGWGAWE